MNELWIMVVGGGDDERLVCEGDMNEIANAIKAYEDEVMESGSDKYFELSTDNRSYTFYNYNEFCCI